LAEANIELEVLRFQLRLAENQVRAESGAIHEKVLVLPKAVLEEENDRSMYSREKCSGP